MSRCRWFLVALVVLVAPLVFSTGAGASIGSPTFTLGPPWCGTPEPDATGNLPSTGTGNFAHIPYYAIKCTLDDIKAQSDGRMTITQIGHSAQNRPLYKVVINMLDSAAQRRDFANWQALRAYMKENPAKAQRVLDGFGDKVKVPIFIQSAIHGNESEGVDAMMQMIKDLATTPYGADPDADTIFDHSVVIFNIDQNPDGRALGQRANGNNFDLNRDFLTQSQPETLASVGIMQEWLPPETLDQHGYVTPTLIEATTKPHNPGLDYDLWLKWNQARIDANEAAMNAIGMQITRPINDWCPNGSQPPASGICSGGIQPGPATAEGWDDWGPFYTPMYSQHIGLNGSTVEMCNSTTFTGCGGRAGARLAQYTVASSTLAFDIANRHDLLRDEFERYRRNVASEPRPPCCNPPFDIANNWMTPYPKAYLIPFGGTQRSNAEANRLVNWLLDNGIVVTTLQSDYTFDTTLFRKGSYVVWMNQAFRGLADTALSIGTDISDKITQLYAPPASWSHGFLWGADTISIPAAASFAPTTLPIKHANYLSGGVEPGHAPGETSAAGGYALKIDSATAVRTLNQLVGEGTPAKLALRSFSTLSDGTYPAGSVIFPSSARAALAEAGQGHGLTFKRVSGSALSLTMLQPILRAPKVVALTGSVSQATWVLQNLGFPLTLVSTATLNTAATDPLEDADVIFNTAGYPAASNTTARARLTTFFARGGGYVGAGANGAAFLTGGGLVTGLTTATRSGNGRSGIINWDNAGGIDSPITGVYPSHDTAIVDPPIWITGVPATMSVDARLPLTDYFASGLWLADSQSASAPGSAEIVHGTNTAGTARLTAFALDPTYRADPEREWPALGSALYWAVQPAPEAVG